MINWSATGFYITAGLCFALRIEPYENFAFIFFLIGHSLSFVNGYRKRIHSLTIRYIFFICIDFIGIYRYNSLESFYDYIVGLV